MGYRAGSPFRRAVWGLLAAGVLGISALPLAADRGAVGSTPVYRVGLSALMDGAGTTDVAVTVTPATPAFSIPSVAKQVQLKGYSAGGTSVLWTRTYQRVPLDAQGVARFQFPGLSRNQPLSVQVVLQTAQMVNAQVYRADSRVLARPDLEIRSVSAPAQVMVQQPVNVQVTIGEANGDSGATCDVVLVNADGTVLDEAAGVSVAAGGTVSVVLTTRFDASGTGTLTVRIQNSSPAEADAADDQNNTASVTIQVIGTVPTSYGVSYSDSTSSSKYYSQVTTYNQTVLKSANTISQSNLTESLSYTSGFATALLSQAGFSVSVTSDGQSVLAATVAAGSPDFSGTVDFGGGNTFSYASYFRPLDSTGTNWINFWSQEGTGAYAGASSSLSVNHYAGSSVYFSSTYVSTWNPPYTSYTTTSQAGTFWHSRTGIHTDIQVIGGDGTSYGGQADLAINGPVTFDYGPATWSFGDQASDSWYSGSQESHSQQWWGSGTGTTY